MEARAFQFSSVDHGSDREEARPRLWTVLARHTIKRPCYVVLSMTVSMTRVSFWPSLGIPVQSSRDPTEAPRNLPMEVFYMDTKGGGGVSSDPLPGLQPTSRPVGLTQIPLDRTERPCCSHGGMTLLYITTME